MYPKWLISLTKMGKKSKNNRVTKLGSIILIISVIITLILLFSCSVMSRSLRPHALQPTRLLCPWEFSRQEYWSELPFPPPGDLPNPGVEPRFLALQVDSLPSETPGKPKERHSVVSSSLWPQGLYRSQNFSGQNTGVGSCSLLQGIFPTRDYHEIIMKIQI